MNELIERLVLAYESGQRAARDSIGELASEAGICAVLAELAKTDVGEAMLAVDEVAAELRKHKPGAGIAAEVAVEFIGARVAQVIAALRARVAELEAHIASRMPCPDIHIAASPEAIDETLAHQDCLDCNGTGWAGGIVGNACDVPRRAKEWAAK